MLENFDGIFVSVFIRVQSIDEFDIEKIMLWLGRAGRTGCDLRIGKI